MADDTSLVTTVPSDSGVYQILCIPPGKIYIGSSVNLPQRWLYHCYKLRRGDHHNIHLQNAWDKYGEANFKFLVLESVAEYDLLRVEQMWMDQTMCTDKNIGLSSPSTKSPCISEVSKYKETSLTDY